MTFSNLLDVSNKVLQLAVTSGHKFCDIFILGEIMA